MHLLHVELTGGPFTPRLACQEPRRERAAVSVPGGRDLQLKIVGDEMKLAVTFADNDLNFLLYKYTASFQWGMIRGGTYRPELPPEHPHVALVTIDRPAEFFRAAREFAQAGR